MKKNIEQDRDDLSYILDDITQEVRLVDALDFMGTAIEHFVDLSRILMDFYRRDGKDFWWPEDEKDTASLMNVLLIKKVIRNDAIRTVMKNRLGPEDSFIFNVVDSIIIKSREENGEK